MTRVGEQEMKNFDIKFDMKKVKWGDKIIPEVRQLLINEFYGSIKKIKGNTVIFFNNDDSYRLHSLINDRLDDIFIERELDLSILARKQDRVTFF